MVTRHTEPGMTHTIIKPEFDNVMRLFIQSIPKLVAERGQRGPGINKLMLSLTGFALQNNWLTRTQIQTPPRPNA